MEFPNLFNNKGYFPTISTNRDKWIASYCQRAQWYDFHPKGFRAESRYRMEKDVMYRVSRKGQDWNPSLGQHDWVTHFIDFKDLPMGDADWVDPSHTTEESVTIEKLGDVLNLLLPWLDANNYTARVYITPGGVRWFITSRAVHPMIARKNEWFKDLPYDPWYATYCCKLDVMGILKEQGKEMYGTFIPRGQHTLFLGCSWAVRISAKKGRENDFIAYPIGKWGNAPEDERLVKLLKIYHDDIIEAQWTKESVAAAKALIQAKR